MTDSVDIKMQPTSDKGVTAFISQVIPEAKVDSFMEWQNGVTSATSKFAGYRGTDLYPPLSGVHDDWVTAVHFDSNADLDVWLKSDERDKWKKSFTEEFGTYDMRKIVGGLGFWFDEITQGKKPPGWKLVLTVVMALSPTVMAISYLIMPYVSSWPTPCKIVFGNFISCILLQYIIMPRVSKAVAWWQNPKEGDSTKTDILGTVMVLSILTAITVAVYFIAPK